jgi:hypothetical protein
VLAADLGRASRGIARWNGTAFEAVSLPSLRAGCDPTGFDYWIVDRADVGIGAGFDLAAEAYPDATSAASDLAPDAPPFWRYRLSVTQPPPPPPPPPRPPPPPPPPAKTMLDGPSLPQRVRYTGASIRHVKAASSIYATMKVVGGGRRLQVACWSQVDWRSVLSDLGDSPGGRTVVLGFWHPAQPRFLHLAPHVCESLQALITTRRGSSARAFAAVVALHETAHMYGVRNEARASCYAVQLVYYLARVLRVARTGALDLERRAVRTARRNAPPGYWDTSRCRDGGVWDLDGGKRNLDY